MLYTHAQCTIAICEIVWHDQRLRHFAARRGGPWHMRVEAQDKEHGGWRYHAPQRLRHVGHRLVHDGAAKRGWPNSKVPDENAARNVMRYLDTAAIDDGRRYGYWNNGELRPTAMCAEGLLCRQYLGWKRDDPRLVEGVTELLGRTGRYDSVLAPATSTIGTTPRRRRITWKGEIWEAVERGHAQGVPAHQVKKGPEAGSWDPSGDKWGSRGWPAVRHVPVDLQPRSLLPAPADLLRLSRDRSVARL